jgi:hypothetical protein
VQHLTLISSKSKFFLETVWTPSCWSSNAQLRDSESYEGSNTIADGEVSSSRSESCSEGPADTEVNKFPSARSLNDYVVTANGGTTLCNRSDARVSRSGCASKFYEVSVAGLDVTYANPSLCRIRISEAYLKRPIVEFLVC